MLEQYRTVYEGGEGEITEKKSRFIATVHPVESEEEALAFLEEMKIFWRRAAWNRWTCKSVFQSSAGRPCCKQGDS